jgi:hypothetical protein
MDSELEMEEERKEHCKVICLGTYYDPQEQMEFEYNFKTPYKQGRVSGAGGDPGVRGSKLYTIVPYQTWQV